ncbi:MAG: hypothetical protein QOG83_2736, partial [Alphaproteobacteria bacterium]|nr:hypothetical protein [Alphaproteobacteria bacterium]
MSRYTGRTAQQVIQAKLGFVSVVALLWLDAPAQLAAQPAGDAAPVAQEAPSTQPATSGPRPTPRQGEALPTVEVDASRPRAPRRRQPARTASAP